MTAFKAFERADLKSTPGDIVIVGAGLAGLFAALKLAPLPVTLLSPAPLGEGASSTWAQGGIAAAVGLGDTPAAHARDTVAAGAGLVDPDVAETIAAEAPDRIADLLRYGVPFDRDLEGHFVLSQEAAHSEKRVVRVSGDTAGKAIMAALVDRARKTPSIRIIEGVLAEDLLQDETGQVVGIRLARSSGEHDVGAQPARRFDLPASAVILATGGIGALYEATTNPPYSLGEGLGMAALAGAVIADAEFVQFHPTALDLPETPNPLASEALRGEGAHLINAHGERFMTAIHTDAELAPRDVVARAVFDQRKATGGAFLDCRPIADEDFSERFETLFAAARRHGLDPARDPLPVVPAAHYHMGGVATDLAARTSIPGLWAIGEVASTGLHGANRLASNSLLEAVVMAARAAADIRDCIAQGSIEQAQPVSVPEPGTQQASASASASARPSARPSQERGRLTVGDEPAGYEGPVPWQGLSWSAGVVRTGDSLITSLAAMSEASRDARVWSCPSLRNPLVAAMFIAAAARLRRENAGAHFRRDAIEQPVDLQRRFLNWKTVEHLAADAASHGRTFAQSRSAGRTGQHQPGTSQPRKPIDPIAALHGVGA